MRIVSVAQYNGSLCENSYPPARLTLYPRAVNFAITLSQWSPWISIFLSLTVPPEPHNFLSCCASVLSSASLPITPSITVTVFPARCLRSRVTRTIPSLLRVGCAGREQRQFLNGNPQVGQVVTRPLSVE